MNRRRLLQAVVVGIGGRLLPPALARNASAGLRPSARPRWAAGRSVVILGGGFGGITTALDLRQALPPEHTVMLVDRKPRFLMGFRKLWIVAGSGTRAEGERGPEDAGQGPEVPESSTDGFGTQ